MDASAVAASLVELEESLLFPASVRAVTVKDATGCAHVLGYVLQQCPAHRGVGDDMQDHVLLKGGVHSGQVGMPAADGDQRVQLVGEHLPK